MSHSNHRIARASQSALVVSLLAVFAATPALAGECPASKVGANALAGAPTKPVGVKDMEIASIDLAGENVKLNQRRLRMRQMEIAPGGIVPLHDHADRPALIMVVEGEIYENSSKCLTPILHKPGEVSREFLGVMHWWKNSGTKTVKLTIADIVNDKKPETMMDHM